MSEGNGKKRRWRYSLRALLVLVTVIAIGLAWWVNGPRRQAEVIRYVRKQGGFVDSTTIAGQWLADRLNGLYGVRVDGVVLDGHAATDEMIRRLHDLRHLQSLSIGRSWGTARGGGIRAAQVAPLTDRGMEYVGRLTTLKELEIMGAYSVTEEGLDHLKHLKNLRRLEFTDTPVTDADLERIVERLPRLWSLSLRGTKVSDEGLRHLKRLEDMRELDLNSASIGDVGMQYVRELRDLEWIDLTGTGVTDDGLRGLEMLPLRGVTVNFTQVSDVGLEHLQRVKTLESVELFGANRVTSRGVEELEMAVPDVEINGISREDQQ